MNYANKQQLLDEINKTAKLFIDEFSELSEAEKDKLIEGVLGSTNSKFCNLNPFSNIYTVLR